MADDSSRPAPPPAWADDLRSRLGTRPVPLDTLAAGIADAHPEVTADEVEAQLRGWPHAHEVDDGWVDLLAAADGAVLTHLLDEDELANGVLVADGDLDLWAHLAVDGLGEIRTRRFPETSMDAGAELVGPEGWLEGFRVEELVALRLRGGALELTKVSGLPEPDPEPLHQIVECGITLAWAALEAYLQLRDEDEEIRPEVPVGYVVADAVATHPGVLSGLLPPVPLLLRTVGLQLDGAGDVSLPGLPEDPDEADDLTAEQLRARIGVATFMLGCDGADEPPEPEDAVGFLDLAAVDQVVDYAADLVECDGLPAEVLDRFRKAADTPGRRAVAALLAARTAEGEEEPARAEELVVEALSHDPGLAPALVDAAEYAATRGDLVAAEGYLKQAGVPRDDPRRAVLAGLVRPPATATGRNQPCPCGSGRKYKLCCLRNAVHSLRERAPLAYAKLIWWAQRAPQQAEVADFEELIGNQHPQPTLLALDLALFDTDLADEYLEARGSLLPEDERALVERWVEAEIAPYEVARVRAGVGVTLRPLLGGDDVELADRAFSTGVRRLDLVVARILHDGERPSLIAVPTWVPRGRRQELRSVFADYDPEALAAFFGPQPPPRLANREGHELVFSEAEPGRA